MKTVELAVIDGIPESKADLVEQHLLPNYKFNYTKFAIPSNIQGQIDAIHRALTILHENLKGENKDLCFQAGAFLEGLEQDLKNYRIEDQDLHL